jgi:uncharacterized protein
MQVSVSAQVREYITSHDTLTLASTYKGQAWATPLFYQVDPDLRFYFISDPATRHIENAIINPCVALSIFEQKQAWQEIQGVQIEGHLARVSDENRKHVETLYCEKFPFIKNLLQVDDNDDARQVKERFLASDFYVVTPGFVRFIDNKRGFGFKEEYYLNIA